MFTKENNAIIWKKGYETLRIESWGTDSLRVRCTMNTAFSGEAAGVAGEFARHAAGNLRAGTDYTFMGELWGASNTFQGELLPRVHTFMREVYCARDG